MSVHWKAPKFRISALILHRFLSSIWPFQQSPSIQWRFYDYEKVLNLSGCLQLIPASHQTHHRQNFSDPSWGECSFRYKQVSESCLWVVHWGDGLFVWLRVPFGFFLSVLSPKVVSTLLFAFDWMWVRRWVFLCGRDAVSGRGFTFSGQQLLVSGQGLIVWRR